MVLKDRRATVLNVHNDVGFFLPVYCSIPGSICISFLFFPPSVLKLPCNDVKNTQENRKSKRYSNVDLSLNALSHVHHGEK